MSDFLDKRLCESLEKMWGGGLDWAMSDDFMELGADERDKTYATYQNNLKKRCLDEIKQAFIDAGWVRSRVATEINGRVYIANGVDPIKRYDGATLMTGQEWYNRFMALAPSQLTEADELDFNLHDDDPEGNCYYAWNCAVNGIEGAAKKAVGIDNE